MTQPTQGVHIRRIYYASGSPNVVEPVLYDNAYDSQPNVDVLDLVLAYNNQIAVDGYRWNGVSQVEDDSIGDGLRADVLAYWTLNESSGTREDSTPNNIDMTNIGTVNGVAGKIEDAARFTVPLENGLRVLNKTVFTSLGDSPISFAFWVKMNDITGAEDHTLLYRTVQAPSTKIDWYVAFNPVIGGDFIYLDCIDVNEDEYGFVFSSVPIVQGNWYFVYGYINPSESIVGIKINITETTEDFYQPPASHGAAPNNCLSIGAEINFAAPDAAQHQSRADIDEVGIWGRLLTSEEQDYLYNGGAGRGLYS